jgi:hypothetical protein
MQSVIIITLRKIQGTYGVNNISAISWRSVLLEYPEKTTNLPQGTDNAISNTPRYDWDTIQLSSKPMLKLTSHYGFYELFLNRSVVHIKGDIIYKFVHLKAV